MLLLQVVVRVFEDWLLNEEDGEAVANWTYILHVLRCGQLLGSMYAAAANAGSSKHGSSRRSNTASDLAVLMDITLDGAGMAVPAAAAVAAGDDFLGYVAYSAAEARRQMIQLNVTLTLTEDGCYCLMYYLCGAAIWWKRFVAGETSLLQQFLTALNSQSASKQYRNYVDRVFASCGHTNAVADWHEHQQLVELLLPLFRAMSIASAEMAATAAAAATAVTAATAAADPGVANARRRGRRRGKKGAGSSTAGADMHDTPTEVARKAVVQLMLQQANLTGSTTAHSPSSSSSSSTSSAVNIVKLRFGGMVVAMPADMAQQCATLAAICDDGAQEGHTVTSSSQDNEISVPPVAGLDRRAVALLLQLAVAYHQLSTVVSSSSGSSSNDPCMPSAVCAALLQAAADLVAPALGSSAHMVAPAAAAAASSSSYAVAVAVPGSYWLLTKDDLVDLWLLTDYLGYQPLFGSIKAALLDLVAPDDAAWALNRILGHPLQADLVALYSKKLLSSWQQLGDNRWRMADVVASQPLLVATLAQAVAECLLQQVQGKGSSMNKAVSGRHH